MGKKIFLIFCFALLMTSLLVGCDSIPIKQVEVTRIVRETVVITEASPTATIAPIQTQTQTPEPVDKSIFSVENSELRILVTKYYVLLDYGLYEEAFNLLDPSSQQNRKLEEYVEGSSVIYDQVKLLRVEAYDEYTKRAGLDKLIPPEGINYVHVDLMAFHKGAKPDEGVIQQLFIELKKTDNEWRINKFATSPPIQDDFPPTTR